jgi:hypothetical protein
MKGRCAVIDLTAREDTVEDSQITRATARRLAELHTAGSDELAGHCWWCLKTWPCPDRVWSDRILHNHPGWTGARR